MKQSMALMLVVSLGLPMVAHAQARHGIVIDPVRSTDSASGLTLFSSGVGRYADERIADRAVNSDALSRGRTDLSSGHGIDGERRELTVEHRIDGRRANISDETVNREGITGDRRVLHTPLGFTSTGTKSGL